MSDSKNGFKISLSQDIAAWKHSKGDPVNEKDAIYNELVDQVKHSIPGARLSFGLRNRLEKLPFEARKEIVNRSRLGCGPLFIACKKGELEIVEYLLRFCGANIEQRGLYEVQEDRCDMSVSLNPRSTHVVTPLWCAAVSGKLSVVAVLLKAGADINAVSDSGSTPIRSACFMTHFEVVKYLVKHGADINKPNYNGGTCLINSVQSAVLCEFLLKHGADVNAKDIQNKTALHYAIQEHRLETTKLLLKYGANHNAVSRYGDDALQMACLKGATRIFEYLTINVYYSPEQLANAHELMGATFLDEHNDLTVCLNHWKQALRIRQENELLPKQPQLTPHEGYRNQKEFESLEELESVSTDLDAVRIQSLLIAERILGAHHKDTIFRLMYRGASYADVVRYQRCIELWRRALQLRIEKDTILYTDTCFTAQALIRLMVDYKIKSVQNKINNTQQRFHDILETFKLLTSNAADVKPLLSIRPQYKRQLEFFEKMVKCITHLIYLMVETIETPENREIVKNLVKDVLRKDIRCVGVGDTILHLCLSRLNTIKSSYFADEEPTIVFPHLGVLEVLLESNAVVNAKNESGWTPLHVATKAYNFDNDVVKLLLKYGAHLDQPDSQSRTPLESISDLVRHHVADLSLINYTSLKCLCASLIVQNKIPYSGQIPKTLENFVKLHEP